MRMNYTDIKQELQANWEQFGDNPYGLDLINGFAESALPIYTNEIIKDWQEMPREYDDTWYEEGYAGKNIVDLMIYDLTRYYYDQYHRIYQELCEEMEMAQ